MIINSVNGGGVPQLPEQVETLTLLPGSLSAILTWAEPQQDQDKSFVGTRIVRKIGSCPQNPHDGDVVYEGLEFTYTDEGLTEDVTYYYRAFAYNDKKKYQNSMRYVSTTASTTFPLSLLPEGSLININENSVAVPFYVAKHDYEADLNGAGRTLLVRMDCHSSRAWHNSVNAYASSSIDKWLNNTYKSLLSGLTEDIGTTEFYYTPGNGSADVTTLSRAVFLLSLTEMGKNTDISPIEGSALPIANTLQITHLEGTAVEQWTRTPNGYSNTSYMVYCLDDQGEVYSKSGKNSNGVRPAFTLPAEKRVQFTIDDDGCYNFA